MKARLIDRIRSERGESIGEALAAMLIVALGALMLEAMTSAATKIVTRSETAYMSYLDQRNLVESLGQMKGKNLKNGKDIYSTESLNATVSLWKSSSDSMAATVSIPVSAEIIKNKNTGKIVAARYQYKESSTQQGAQASGSN